MQVGATRLEGEVRLAIFFATLALAMMLVTGVALNAQTERMAAEGRWQGNPSEVNKQLWMGAYYGHLDQVQSALAQGANPNFKGKGGFTPIVIAARNGYLEIVQYLMDHGAEMDKRDNSRKKSALLAAAFKSQNEVAEYLLAHGADINAQAINGFTPLHDAAWVGDYQLVKLLVERGARTDIKNNDGQTALECAEIGRGRAPEHGRTNATPEDYQQTIDYLKAHTR
jgi:ankyrin repeat protein